MSWVVDLELNNVGRKSSRQGNGRVPELLGKSDESWIFPWRVGGECKVDREGGRGISRMEVGKVFGVSYLYQTYLFIDTDFQFCITTSIIRVPSRQGNRDIDDP